jgi:putative SOS response-associated peptidase YedK
MCGRYSLSVPPEEFAQHFGLSDVPDLEPRYNVAPTQDMPVVRLGHDAREALIMRWGLVPFSAASPDGAARMINARSETVADKPSFRWAFQKTRCLVPADGFYEWKRMESGKHPYHITLRDRRLFAFAGLWDEWTSRDGNRLLSYTILTTEPNQLVRPIHDRMPVILPPEHYEEWLDPGANLQGIQEFLRPTRADAMIATAVSDRVNSVKNEGPALILPAPEPLELDLFSAD